jgi:hypothetical protein
MPRDTFATAAQIRAEDFKGLRFDMIWSRNELRHLIEMYYADFDLDVMAHALERPKSGIIGQLCNRRIIFPDEMYGSYYHNIEATYERVMRRYFHVIDPTSRPITDRLSSRFYPELQQLPKEYVMPPKNIEKITLIAGENAANKTDGEIFEMIGKLETQIKRLETIEHKPKKLSARIEELKKDINDLVEYVDSRDVKTE